MRASVPARTTPKVGSARWATPSESSVIRSAAVDRVGRWPRRWIEDSEGVACTVYSAGVRVYVWSVTGIDISHFQGGIPAGDWEFVVAKATEGIDRHDEKFVAHWTDAARFPRRGAYHYALGGIPEGGAKQ